jgi:hypothetical protein
MPVPDKSSNPIIINKSMMEKNTCQSTKEGKSGTSRLHAQTVNEYNARLGLGSKKTRKNSTIN